jgi:hypothetical protein
MARSGFRPVPECIPGETPHRRYDIDQAILRQLNPDPKTAHGLWRDLNPHMWSGWIYTSKGPKRVRLHVAVDYRTLKRHLRYLERDGLIDSAIQLKVLKRASSETAWSVRYYHLRRQGGGPPPPSAPQSRLKPTSTIHNPFHGASGARQFIEWLANPELQ